MKKSFFSAVLAALLVFSISSCKKEGCEAGYEGDPCTAINELHMGSYTGSTNCDGTSLGTGIVEVTAGAPPTTLVVEINGDALNASVSVSNSAQFHLTSQTVGSITYSDINGTFTDNTLVLSYTATIGGNTSICSFTGEK